MEFLLTVLFGFIYTFATPTENLLQQVQREGVLRVATRRNLTTYYQDSEGQIAGLEYELVQRFAQALGVKAEFVLPEKNTDILPLVIKRRVHFAAPGLIATDNYQSSIRLGPNYQYASLYVIYKRGTHRPRNLKQLGEMTDTCLLVPANSLYEEQVHKLQQDYPDISLHWKASTEQNTRQMLAQVAQQYINFTIASEYELKRAQGLYPDIKEAFLLSEGQNLSWIFPRFGQDESLYLASILFFNRLRQSGELEQLVDRYYGHTEDFNYYNIRVFKQK